MKKLLIEVYKGPFAEYNGQRPEVLPNGPTKWDQHYVKYVNGLQADIMRKKNCLGLFLQATTTPISLFLKNRNARIVQKKMTLLFP